MLVERIEYWGYKPGLGEINLYHLRNIYLCIHMTLHNFYLFRCQADMRNEKIFDFVGSSFFRYAIIIGQDSFQHTSRDTINTSGIDLEGLEVSNQSLRVSAFMFHHKLGFIEEETGAGDC